MRILRISIISIFLSTNLAAQTAVVDSTKIDKKIDELNNTLSTIQSRYQSINDSLEIEISKFQAREDYLSVALEDQASRFSLIVTGLLALAALLSYVGYKFELNRLKSKIEKQLENQKDDFKKYRNKIEGIDSSLRMSSANTYVTISTNFAKEEQYHLALEYSICAARDNSKSLLIDIELNKDADNVDSFKLIEKDDCKTIIANLEYAIDMLTKVKSTNIDLHKTHLSEIKSNISENLSIINNVDNEDVADLVAEMRIGIKNFIKESA